MMDSASLDETEHFHALKDLGELNLLSLTARTIWREIHRLTPNGSGKIRILDVACGGGDIALGLSKLAGSSQVLAQVDGCDLSPRAVRFARAKARRLGSCSRFFSHQAVGEPLPVGYDFYVSSLFVHHLQNDEIVHLLEEMAASARAGFVLSDLLRSKSGYILAHLTTRVLSGSAVIHSDSLSSVRASFTLSEVTQLAQRARLVDFTLKKTWPSRWLLSWSRHAAT